MKIGRRDFLKLSIAAGAVGGAARPATAMEIPDPPQKAALKEPRRGDVTSPLFYFSTSKPFGSTLASMIWKPFARTASAVRAAISGSSVSAMPMSPPPAPLGL